MATPTNRPTTWPAGDARDDAAADLLAYARTRDPAARDRAVRRHLPLAHAIARRFDRGGSVPLEDLQQIAALGLVKALERYDPDNGAAFSTFAVPTMQGEIRRYFRDHTWTVRPPRDLQEQAVRIEREREHLTAELGRSPTAAETAERMGGTVEEVVDALQAAQARTGDSLERPFGGEDDADTLAEVLGADDAGYATAEARVTIERLLGDAQRTRRARRRAALPSRPDPGRDRRAGRVLADARLAHPARRHRHAQRRGRGARAAQPGRVVGGWAYGARVNHCPWSPSPSSPSTR